MAVTALATLLVVEGLLSLAAAMTSRGGRAPALVLAWALLQHGANELSASGALAAATGHGRLWSWVALVTGYAIAVPWALPLEQMLGRGWRSTIRWTWRAFAIAALGSIAFDALVGRPGAAAPASRLIIAAGAGVALLNLWPGVPASTTTARSSPSRTETPHRSGGGRRRFTGEGSRRVSFSCTWISAARGSKQFDRRQRVLSFSPAPVKRLLSQCSCEVSPVLLSA